MQQSTNFMVEIHWDQGHVACLFTSTSANVSKTHVHRNVDAKNPIKSDFFCWQYLFQLEHLQPLPQFYHRIINLYPVYSGLQVTHNDTVAKKLLHLIFSASSTFSVNMPVYFYHHATRYAILSIKTNVNFPSTKQCFKLYRSLNELEAQKYQHR